MSLTAVAVVSRQGAPLYLRSFANESNNLFLFDQIGDGESDIFGDGIITTDEITASKKDDECSPQMQFILHSAFEKFEEVLRENNWKAPGGFGNACWVGLLCLSNHLRAYGYVTTNEKYVLLLEDSIESTQLQKADNETCILMANIHRLYTESLLNPFTSLHSKITSKRFDSGVASLVGDFNGR